MQSNTKQRRRHAPELKAQVLRACDEPGVSVAAVAREYGLNDNLVHQWRRGRGSGVQATKVQQPEASTPAQFIALPLPTTTPTAASEPAAADLRLEIRRGAVVVNVTWPLTAASASAAWLREVLR